MYMKVTCDVIRDLMILCEDDVCSEDSMQLIKEHIAGCEECRKIYEMVNAPIPDLKLVEEKKDDEKEEQAIKAFKKVKNKITIETMIKFTVIVLMIFTIHHIWQSFIESRVNVIPPSEVEVTEVYQLDNGDYYITMECEGQFSWDKCEVVFLPENGNRLTSEEFCYKLNFQYPFFWEGDRDFYSDKISLYLPKENCVFGKDYPTKECVSIQYVSGNEVLTIWEEGQPVTDAPEEIERRIDEEIELYNPGFSRSSAGVILEE